MQNTKTKKIPPAKELAYTALTCAVLIGGQYVFSFVVGVEIVTLILACFAYCMGVRNGVICAAAFSLLRCIIFGFYPTALILYLLYYPMLAAVFGGLGKIKSSTFENLPLYLAVIVNAVLLAAATACAVVYALDLIKISRIYKYTLHALLWVIFALCVCLCLIFDGFFIAGKIYKKNSAEALKAISFSAVGAVCTVIFTLLDDVITPTFYGYSRGTALAYFYASFTAMLPQVVCTIITVCTLFLPLTRVINKATSPHRQTKIE